MLKKSEDCTLPTFFFVIPPKRITFSSLYYTRCFSASRSDYLYCLSSIEWSKSHSPQIKSNRKKSILNSPIWFFFTYNSNFSLSVYLKMGETIPINFQFFSFLPDFFEERSLFNIFSKDFMRFISPGGRSVRSFFCKDLAAGFGNAENRNSVRLSGVFCFKVDSLITGSAASLI